MNTWELINVLVGFVILPIGLVYESWHKTCKTSWEWVPFAFWAMSTYIALSQFWLLPTFAVGIKNLNFPDGIAAVLFYILRVSMIWIGPALYFLLWRTVEEPTITEPEQWRLFRSITSVVALVLFFLPGVVETVGIQPTELMQNVVTIVFTVTLIAFAFAQVKIVGGRVLDASRIVADTSKQISNENMLVRKVALRRLGKVAEHSTAAQDLIIGFLEDEDDEILRLALKYVKHFSVSATAAVPSIVKLMAKDKPPISRERIHNLLVEITGTDQGPDAESWGSWVEQNFAKS